MQKYIDNTYEIIEKIGAGNGGTVYKAYHRNLNKYVVLKKSQYRYPGSDEYQDRGRCA